MCKVEIAANKLGHLVGKGDFYHLHIIFTDDTGKQFGLRGGPSDSPGSSGQMSNLSGGSSRAGSLNSSGSGSNYMASSASGGGGAFGYIETTVEPYKPEFIDYPQDGEILPKTTISEGPDSCGYFEKLKEQMQLIDSSKTRYNPLGPNSNTTVFTAIQNVGLTPKVPEGVWAPGASDKIDIVQKCESK